MGKAIGVLATRHIWTGLVEGTAISGQVRVFPPPGDRRAALRELPADALAERIAAEIEATAGAESIEIVGVGFPGIIREGVVEECPNLQQMKGYNLGGALRRRFPRAGRVDILNDTDAMAAGTAATRGHLEKVIRVWYLGDGIGFGRYPRGDFFWEAGHSVVSLDSKERYCGCGGAGHLEGIMGYRAMRKRFLDMEPEEVFAGAKEGDARCSDFVKLWHRALAAGSATSISLDGPGRFYLLGPNAEYVDTELLNVYLHEMIAMSTLQGSQFEKIESGHELAIVGAAVHATQSAAVVS